MSVLAAATVVYGIPVGPIISAEAAGNYGSAILGDSPNAYWRLGDAAGATAAADATGHGNTLTVQGAVAFGAAGAITGDSSTAAQFSSATAVLTRTSAPVTTTANWTLEAWLYPTSLPQSSVAMYNGIDASGQGGYGFGIGSSTGGSGSNLIANLGSAGFVDSAYTFPAANRWYHIALTRDATTLRFYVNGQPTTGSSTTAPAAVGARFSIGAGVNGSGAAVSPFSGTIDEPAVYAAPVSAGRIAAHYQEGAAAISGFGNWIGASPATKPAARFDASVVYDAARDKVLMFGGKNSAGAALAETWTYDGTNWTQLTPATSPPARWGAAGAYNAANSTVVIFGGLAGTTYMNDTWSWNGTTWTKGPTTKVPPVRFDAGAAYNAANSTTVLFGGYNGSAYLQDTWTWNGTAWTSLTPATKPGVRASASTGYHTATSKVMLFGGYNGSSYLNDTWTWNGTTWAQVATNTSPAGRRNGTMAYDATTSTLVLNGGLTSTAPLSDTWTWDGSIWSLQSPGSSPSIRSGAGAAYSTASNSVVMFGGLNGTTSLNDTLTWNTPPAAPTSVAATPGNGQVVVSWTPGSNGGQAVTGYTVTPIAGTTAGTPVTTGAVSTTTISGLTNGTLYTFQVTGTNAVGTGAAAISPQVKPTGPPGPPTNVVATAGVGQATVTWGAPVSDGGSALTGYTITPYAGGAAGTPVSVGTSPTSKSFTGLTGGTTYYYAIAATNALGTGAAATSNSVVPTGVPGVPTNLVATAGNTQATVNWSPPSNNGGSAITGYTITPVANGTPGTPISVGPSPTSKTISSLVNGTSYTFQVTATNGVGTGAAATSNPVTPSPTVPSAPTSVAATPGNGQATVTWNPPTDNGGSAITGYTITPFPNGTAGTPVTVGPSPTSKTISGLVNGTPYTFQVSATNGVGAGAVATSNQVTPAATVPSAPTNVVATGGNGQATVNWSPPTTDGGAAVTGYTITPIVNGTPGTPVSVAISPTTRTFNGLINGTSYTFQVTATNSVGTGAAASSNQVIPAPTAPSAPTNIVATSGDGMARVSWSPPTTDGGAAITGYTITPFASGTPGTPVNVGTPPSTQTMSGLSNGTPYTFQITATNAVGTGAAAVSAQVTPAGPGPSVPGPPTSVTAGVADGGSLVQWVAPNNGGSAITSYTLTPYIGTTAGPPVTVVGSPPATAQSITGLTNGTTYVIYVSATNSIGSGPAGVSNLVTPAAVPGVPATVTAVAGNAQATVTWAAPASGGATIQTYTVTTYTGNTMFSASTVTGGVSSLTMSGLTNGTPYYFTVAATNAAGPSQVGTSNVVTPATLPDAPFNISVASGSSTATVSWTAPSNNGSPIASYTVTSYAGLVAGSPLTVTAAPAVISGLTNGTTYTFQVVATNSVGTSGIGISNAVIVGTSPPTGVTATSPGSNQATVTWSAPAGGTSAPTGYLVTAYSGLQAKNSIGTGVTTTVTLSGLSAGNYTFQVVALNSSGISVASLPSGSLAVSGVTSTYASTIQADGPSIYYRLDESSGTLAADSSGNGRGASYWSTGTTQGAAGALNDGDTAVGFANGGVSQLVPGPGLPTGNAARSLEAWVKTTATGPIVRYGGQDVRIQFDLRLTAGNQLQLWAYNDGPTFTTPHWVSDGAWHQVVATYDPSNVVTMYLDGVSLGSAPFNGVLNTIVNNNGLLLGNDQNGTLTGSVDEVALYPYVLTAAQVAAHFNASGNSRATAPGGVTATSTLANQATVSWTASTASAGAPVTGYLVTAYAGSKAQTSLAVSGSTTSATITGLKGGTAYSFQVTAMNTYGNSPSGISGTVTPTGATSTYASTIQADGPSIYYRFSETTGTLLTDSSGNGRPGGVYGSYALGAVSAIAGDGDSSISLSGGAVNQSAAGAGLPTGNSARSMEAWFKTTGTGPIMWYGNQSSRGLFDLTVGSATQLELVAWGDDHWFTAPHSLADGSWHYVVATYDSSTLTVYLDGQTLGNAMFGGPLNTFPDSNGLLLGNDYWSRLTATLDEVAIYPKALTATQVAAHFNASGNAALPSAPTAVTATAGSAQASVTWNAASGNGGTVSSYTVTPLAGTVAGTPQQVNAPTTSATVTGLTDGTTYTFQVTANSNFGTGPAGTSNAVTVGAPGVPTGITAQAGNLQATISWNAPPSNSSGITAYTVTPFAGSSGGTPTTVSGTPPATNVTVTGLTNGTTYTFQVTASNAQGSSAGGISAALLVGGPSAPGNVTATIPGTSNQALVSWSAATSNGLSITGYVVTAYLGSQSVNAEAVGASATSATVTGLVGGTGYGFQVAALTSAGAGASGTSPIVTPGGAAATYASTVLADGPAAYYRLGDPSGTTAADSSGGGASGTYTGGYTLAQPGALTNDSDTAVSFDGSSGYVVAPSSTALQNTNKVSIELWLKKTSDTQYGMYVTKNFIGNGGPGSGWYQLMNYGGHLEFRVTGDTGATMDSAQSLATNRWYYVVATYDGATAQLYIDGKLDSSLAIAAVPAQSSTPLYIGRRADGYFNNAVIDDVAVYPYPLTASQISAHQAAGGLSVPSPPTPVNATAGTNQATVTWSAPAGTTTRYMVTAYLGSQAQNAVAVDGTLTSAVISGLRAGSVYTFQVVAYNRIGASSPGISGPITPTGTTATYASTVLADGPVEYYRLGESSGTVAADSSGSNQQGNYGGTYVLGGAGALPNDGDKSASFNGATMTAPEALLPTGNGSRTFEAWVNTSNGNGVQGIVGYGTTVTRSLFDLRLYNNSTLGLVTWNDDHYFAAGRSLTNGQWHQVVATYDGPSLTLKLYVDGNVIGQAALADALGTQLSGSGLVVGRDSWQNNESLNGSVDEVSVYGAALSAAQVAAHFQASGNAAPAAPTAATASAGANQATVSWTAPAGTVTGYLVTASSGGKSQNAVALSNVTSTTFTGLTVGFAYTFQVVASNNFGNSPPSSASVPVTISTGSSGGYATTVVADGPVEYYRMGDVGSGLAADSSGAGLNGTYSGTYTLGTGSALINDPDQSASFNGGTMVAPDSALPMGNGPRTIETWINTTASNCCPGLAIAGYGSNSTRSRFQLRLVGTNQIAVVTGNDDHTFTAGYPLANGVWHQIVATYDGTTLVVFADGQSIGQTTLADALGTISNGSGLVVGRESLDQYSYSFNGSVDEVGAYAKALTAGQVAAHWAAAGYRRPSAPIDVKATAGPQGAIVSWTAPSDPGNPPMTGYTITPFAGSVAGTPVVVGLNLTNVTLSGLSAQTAYTFQVKSNAIYDPPISSSGAITTALAQTPVPSNSAYVLEVAYPDNYHYGQTFVPNPWQGAPNTTFIGDAGPWDGTAIRIHDLSGSGLTLNDLQLDIGPFHFGNTWGTNIAVPAGGDLILTEMSSQGLDTSETPVGGCTQSGYIPVIHATVNGLHIDWKDFDQVLNTGGIDSGDCNWPPAEGHDWSIVHNGPLPSEVMGPNGSMKICWTCMGLPVNTASGDFWHSFTDFDIPGRGFNLHVDRTYNSQAAPYDSRFGYGWSDSYNMFLTYDQASGMVAVRQEAGAAANFTVSGTTYTPTTGILATLVRNPDGTFTFQRTDLAKYTFNPRGELISETDRNGYVTGFTYNSSDQLATVTEPAGRTLTFTYTGSHVSQTHDTAGNRTVSYTYDANGNMTSATDMGGAVTKFTYDQNHLMLSMTDPNGGTVTNVFDGSGRDTRQTDAMGRVTQFAYTQGKTTITDPNGNQTVDLYENGQLMQETKAFGTLQAATWSYSYDPISWGVATVKDPNGNITTNTWDANGNLLTKTDALLQTSTYTYNSLNEVLTAKDPLGTVTTNTYDPSGNLTQTSTPLAGTAQVAVTGFAYDPSHAGDLTSMTDGNSKVWTYGYDAYGLRNRATDPLGDVTTSSYDNVGRLQSTVSPNGNVAGGNPATYTTSFSFNAYGDRLSAIDPLGHATTYKYDANRNQTVVIDGNNKQTSYVFDADNEPVQVVRADGSTLKTEYDGNGNVLKQIDGLGNATVYLYNGLNQRTKMTDPLLRATQYGFDGVGNVLTVQNPKDATVSYTMGYDVVNQLKSITYSDGVTPNVAYQYDADGQRKQMTDGTGTTTYTFDSLHRLTQNTNGANAQVQYGYDLIGHVTRLVYPGGVNAVSRTYDDAGRLASVSDWLTNTTRFGFDANGNMTSQTYPNSVVASLTYDAVDRLMQITDVAGSNQLLNLSYARDGSNKLTGENSTTYGYDSSNRLRSSATGPKSMSYTYDAADNLTKISGDSITTQVFDSANQLQNATTMNGATENQKYTYGYDANGNRTTRTDLNNAVTTYRWDQANELTAYGSSVTYAYNGDGLRMTKTNAGVAEEFSWDLGNGLPVILQDGTTSYVTGPGSLPLEQISPTSGVSYYHSDQLGSTRALTDNRGYVTDTYAYSTFGDVTSRTGGTANPFQFAGQFWDSESGLQYLRARYYDSGVGQFLARDPADLLTRQAYSYVSNSPLNGTDASGLREPQDGSNQTGALTCNIPDANDPCFQRYQDIWSARNELAKRLDKSRPYGGFDAGHAEQFINWQKRLRRLLQEWNTDNCPDHLGSAYVLPADAWQYATMGIQLQSSSSFDGVGKALLGAAAAAAAAIEAIGQGIGEGEQELQPFLEGIGQFAI